ncbi:3-phosphoglycerate kinase, partial [Pseudoloma neurophilia]
VQNQSQSSAQSQSAQKNTSNNSEISISDFVKKYDFFIPVDFLNSDFQICTLHDLMHSDEKVYDTGPKSQQILKELVNTCENVFWNGPLGMFEDERCKSTKDFIQFLDENKIDIFVGGGETVMAVRKYSERIERFKISTGGGSLLTLMSGGSMPGLEICEMKYA